MARYSVSEWGCIIDDAQDHSDELFNLINKQLDRRNPPGTSRKVEDLTTKGLWFIPVWRKKREFLTIRTEGLKDYIIDICADPYGNTLAVHAGLNTLEKPEDLDAKKVSWENQTMLSDWTSVVFRCVEDACSELMVKLEQDPSLLKRDIKGVLSVW